MSLSETFKELPLDRGPPFWQVEKPGEGGGVWMRLFCCPQTPIPACIIAPFRAVAGSSDFHLPFCRHSSEQPFRDSCGFLWARGHLSFCSALSSCRLRLGLWMPHRLVGQPAQIHVRIGLLICSGQQVGFGSLRGGGGGG